MLKSKVDLEIILMKINNLCAQTYSKFKSDQIMRQNEFNSMIQ